MIAIRLLLDEPVEVGFVDESAVLAAYRNEKEIHLAELIVPDSVGALHYRGLERAEKAQCKLNLTAALSVIRYFVQFQLDALRGAVDYDKTRIDMTAEG